MDVAQTFFHDTAQSNEKCHFLTDNHALSLLWEQESVSLHSPGIVQDEECLARNIYSPHQYDKETGDLTSLAFDDVFNKGLSVLRLDYANHDAIVQIGQEKKKETHAYHGYVTAPALLIRRYEMDKKRAMAIYDTATIENPIHADVCSINASSKGNKKLLRIYLRSIFSSLNEVA